MNINIYYGGRGFIEDPTLYVLGKIENVFEELRVNVTRYNLFDIKNAITTLPQTLKDVDGVILAVNVEWLGIGGYMQQFLDACWLYGDKNKIGSIYMMPVVTATTYGEKEAQLTLIKAWELLGGLPCNGISSYVEDTVEFEMNQDWASIIEKSTESLYRTISQKIKSLPSSNHAIKRNLLKASFDLTPQESEQLSKYAADDIYVKKQKEDIEELASMFKGMLDKREVSEENEFIKDFEAHFTPQPEFASSYLFKIDNKKDLLIEISYDKISCSYSKSKEADVVAKLSHDVMLSIVEGRLSFQRAFMSGDMTAKGNFKTLRMLDQLFEFNKKEEKS